MLRKTNFQALTKRQILPGYPSLKVSSARLNSTSTQFPTKTHVLSVKCFSQSHTYFNSPYYQSRIRSFSTNQPAAPTQVFTITNSKSSDSSKSTPTDPLQIYEEKVANGELFRDEAQYKAAVELQKLSDRLVDYTPPTAFKQKIKELSQMLEVC